MEIDFFCGVYVLYGILWYPMVFIEADMGFKYAVRLVDVMPELRINDYYIFMYNSLVQLIVDYRRRIREYIFFYIIERLYHLH